MLCCAGKQTGIFTQIVAAMQAWMMRVIQQHGFYGILLLASWPNAAFDLCGICCGAFMMPFWEFFGATLIGKGVIKVSGQSLFFVALFRWAACLCGQRVGWLVTQNWSHVLHIGPRHDLSERMPATAAAGKPVGRPSCVC